MLWVFTYLHPSRHHHHRLHTMANTEEEEEEEEETEEGLVGRGVPIFTY